MATRPQNHQTNTIELDAYGGQDPSLLEAREVAHVRLTEGTAGEVIAANTIRASFGVEPLVYEEPTVQPTVFKTEITETPEMPLAPTTVQVENAAQISTPEVTPAKLTTSVPTEEMVSSEDEARARQAIMQAITEQGDQQVQELETV